VTLCSFAPILLILILNLILLAGPVLLEAGPVLLSANITYSIDFKFDPVASQQALSVAHEIKTHHRLSFVKPHFIQTQQQQQHMRP
jgi:hypothetical protein